MPESEGATTRDQRVRNGINSVMGGGGGIEVAAMAV